MLPEPAPPAERFRALFHRLDAASAWQPLLPPPALRLARRAAASPGSWHRFFTSADPEAASPPPSSPAPPPTRTSPAATPHPSPAATPKPSPSAAHPRTPRRGRPRSPALVVGRVVRRRLAIAAVDRAVFSDLPVVNPPHENAAYEPDLGIMPGDDGGYTDYADLHREERRALRQVTGVYTLLGCDDDPEAPACDEDPSQRVARPASSPKRPRRTPALGLADEMEAFVRGLRQLCEPHRDAAQVESDKGRDVPKNIHRKAVSAASVVEELKELEHKAAIGRFERVEECISAVSACIGNQDETFRDVLGSVDDRAETLRDLQRQRREKIEAVAAVKELTTGILGGDTSEVDALQLDDEMDTDDETKPDINLEDVHDLESTTMQIPYSEADLRCWPSNDLSELSEMSKAFPRLPVFHTTAMDKSLDGTLIDSTNAKEKKRAQDDLVSIIGLDNPVMKNVLGLLRIHRLRKAGFAKLQVLTRRKAQVSAKAATGNAPAGQNARASTTKTEHAIVPISTPGGASQPIKVVSPQGHLLKGSIERGSNQSREGRLVDLDIKNDPFSDADSGGQACSEARERALARSACALMLCHGGFTHASSTALDITADVLEHFVTQIGRSLTSCRENIDREEEEEGDPRTQRVMSKNEAMEQLDIISNSGFRGGFPRLVNYIKSDLVRIEQSSREAESRLRMQLSKLDSLAEEAHLRLPPSPGEKDKSSMSNKKDGVSDSAADTEKLEETSKEEIYLDDAAFTFGYVTNTVRFDVLGSINVPRELALKDSGRDPSSVDKAFSEAATNGIKVEGAETQLEGHVASAERSPMDLET